MSLPGNTDPEDQDEEGRGGGDHHDDGDGSEKYASNIKLNRNRLDEGAVPPLVTHTLIQTITRTSRLVFISNRTTVVLFSTLCYFQPCWPYNIKMGSK